MKSYYLGGDVSKGYCDFILLDQRQRIVGESFQLDDTVQGHQVLTEKLISFLKENPQSVLYVGFESTGGYENNWFHSLSKLSPDYNIKVARLNSLGVSHHHKASLKRNTTDPISARNIAEYLIAHAAQVNYKQQSSLKEARSLYTHIEMLTKQCTQLLNHLESEVYRASPSLMCYWKDEMPQWLLSVMKKWPTASNLSKASVRELSAIPYVNKERALELKQNAGKSIASAFSEVTGLTIQSLATQIIQMRETINKLKKALYSLMQIPEIEILKSLPGISDYSACGLMLEIEKIERFSKSNKLCAYFGVHPVYKKSGDGVWGYHLSKQGRRRPRRLLYLAAMNAVQNDLMFKGLYDFLLKAGRVKIDALCILMHKMLRIIYGMLKSKRKYDPMINRKHRDQYHKNKSQKKEIDKKVVKARRLQEYDQTAPISRRQTKKRKNQMDNQQAERDSMAGIKKNPTKNRKQNGSTTLKFLKKVSVGT
jgi:transposase